MIIRFKGFKVAWATAVMMCWLSSAGAVEITYFIDYTDNKGAGNITLDDTTGVPINGEVVYDLDVDGSGPLGDWEDAGLIYDPSSGGS
jgi:hypothetical protein